jgi:hypothetical protein
MLLYVLGTAGCANTDTDTTSDSISAEQLVALPAIDHLDAQAREPMLVETSDGSLYVTGYGESTPRLWRSADGGRTWTGVNVGTESTGAIGNSDVDLALAPDGTVYFVAMSYDRAKFEGTGISIAASRDGGATWKWTAVSRDRFDDRPWVEVAPDGTAHVIWNDGAGVSHAISTDRGETWVEGRRVHHVGGSSHFAISPTGVLAVRITPLSASANKFDAGVDHISISTDGGATWVVRSLPGNRQWSPFEENSEFLRWVEPVAWDSAGHFYALWSEGNTLWVARSDDQARSWKSWQVAQDSTPLYFPYLVARGNGELAATWFNGLRESIKANVAHIRIGSDSSAPRVTKADAFAFPSFSRRDTSAVRRRDTAGEYIPVAFMRDGRIALVTTIQDNANKQFGFTFRPYRLTPVR